MTSKTRKKIRNVLTGALLLVIGFSIGILYGFVMDRAFDDFNLTYFMISLLLLFIAYFLNIILHEAGHMVMGLLTGYRFLSFRVFSLMIMKMEDGSYKWSRFSIPGTLGQCLLIPPELDENRMMPYVLYNLGGIMVNFLIFTIASAIYFLTPITGTLSCFVGLLALVGLVVGLTNGIPLSGEINNDGANIQSMNRNRRVVESLWKQLTINAYQTQGRMFSEMPDELFTLPSLEEMQENNLISADAVFLENRLMEQMNHYKTLHHINWLLDTSKADLLSMYRIMLNSDKILLELLEGLVPDLNKNVLKQLKQFSIFPNVLVTRYAIATLDNYNEKERCAIRKQYDKVMKKWPFRTDLVTLPKYMNEIDSKYQERKTND